MIRLLVVTLAALYAILHVFGDEARRPEVARSEPMGLGIVKAAYFPEDAGITTASYASDITDEQAIQLALDAGVQARGERKLRPLLGGASLVANAAPAPAAATEEPPAYWYVTGTRVNLRSGPGTSNRVVGSLTLGAEAQVLADNNGWYQVRTTDGAVSGWIFGKFLAEQLPG